MEVCQPGVFTLYYKTHEFYLSSPTNVLASLCLADGGASSFQASVAIYQAAGGMRVEPFTPNGCQDAVAVNNRLCLPQAQGASADLQAGYFYVVVMQAAGGAVSPYTLGVHGVTTCPATPTPTGTPPTATLTPTPTATVCAITRSGSISLSDPTFNRP